MVKSTVTDYAVLARGQWLERSEAHSERAYELTRDHLWRRSRGLKHPIEDFLFTYYNLKPQELARWHPGSGLFLADGAERSGWKYYSMAETSAFVDARAFYLKRGPTMDYIDNLFQNTLDNAPFFGCFGMHEWAMVYRLTPVEIRHRGLPLRLGSATTDAVVETASIRCSHFDAYRFFTPEAKPLNELNPTRDNQPETEQAGCLHAGMDVYKWAMKLGPLIPGELLLDSFELARDIRQVDMQASPYDVSDFGLPAIPVETPEGKAEYARLQRGFAKRANELRSRALVAISGARRFI